MAFSSGWVERVQFAKRRRGFIKIAAKQASEKGGRRVRRDGTAQNSCRGIWRRSRAGKS